MQQPLTHLAIRIQATIRFQREGVEEHTSTLRRGTNVLDGIRQRMGIPLTRAIICGLFLCRDRSRDDIQLDASDKQTRSLSTIVPEYNQRRDPAPSGNNGASTSNVPRVHRGTETHGYTPDETGFHLPISTPLRAQVRVLAATIRFRQGRS